MSILTDEEIKEYLKDDDAKKEKPAANKERSLLDRVKAGELSDNDINANFDKICEELKKGKL